MLFFQIFSLPRRMAVDEIRTSLRLWYLITLGVCCVFFFLVFFFYGIYLSLQTTLTPNREKKPIFVFSFDLMGLSCGLFLCDHILRHQTQNALIVYLLMAVLSLSTLSMIFFFRWRIEKMK